MWSIVCSPLLQQHMGLSLILYLSRYDLILPCPVTVIVKFGVTLILSFNLSVIFGKKVFVLAPFVVMSHSLCHFVARGRVADHNHLLTKLRLTKTTPPLPHYAVTVSAGAKLTFQHCQVLDFCMQNFLSICVILFSTPCCDVFLSGLY